MKNGVYALLTWLAAGAVAFVILWSACVLSDRADRRERAERERMKRALRRRQEIDELDSMYAEGMWNP